MIDFLIAVLQTFKLVVIVLGVISILLAGFIVTADLFRNFELESIHIPRRRIGRHRRGIKTAISQYYDEKIKLVRDLSEWISDRRDEKARWQKEKEDTARGKGFFDAFHVPRVTGSFVYRNGIKFPTELSEKYYRKLEELADKLIFDSTEVL